MDIEAFKVKVHRFLNRDIGIILTYHSVVDCPLEFDMWTHMPLALFEEHMAILNRETNVIPLGKMVEGLRQGYLPKYAVAVTFDDGFGNNYQRAYPVLKRYGIPATIFLTTGFIGTQKLFWPERLAYQLMRTGEVSFIDLGFSLRLRDREERRQAYVNLRDYLKKLHPRELETKLEHIEKALNAPYLQKDALFREWLPLDWKQVREMAKTGLIDFGGHTVDHHILTRLNDAEAEAQIDLCRKTLDEQIGSSPPLWAFPNGTIADYSACHSVMLHKFGFSTSFTAEPSYITIESNPASLGRWGIGSSDGVHKLRNILSKRDRWNGLNRGNHIFKAISCHLFDNREKEKLDY